MYNSHTQDFLTISLNECRKVYPVVKENAERHFRCAEILAAEKQFSNAIAHLILGSEELLKALALLLESEGFELRKAEGYKKLFSNHRVRHSILKEFYSVILFVKKITDLIEDKKKRHWFMQLLHIGITSLEGISEAIENHEWWNNADFLKQSCFYVDYANEVLSPDKFNEEDFNKASKWVGAVRTDVRIIIIGFKKFSEAEKRDLKNQFHQIELPKLVEGSIKRTFEKK